jgi:nuclear pore complex protein Nup188
MLDADLALTKAFKSLAEAARTWTEGDNLAMAACLRASKEIATIVADEDRAGDVMFTIQAERVEVLSILLDTALGQEAEVDKETINSLFEVLTRILESQDFPPTTGLRHPEITLIPAIHRPILRILLLLLQTISTFSPPIPTVQLDPVVKVITNFTLEAADIILDTLIQQPEAPLSTSIDLSLVVGILCEIVRTPLTSIWLNKISEHNLIGRSLEVIVRMRINNDRVPTHITSILLLHLALASNPLSAEKLAVSGILPAYSNNGIMTIAEQGKIVPSSPFPAETSLHGGWCSILMVVKALLFSLPLAHAGTFARSDVVPFIRASQVQVLKTLSWDGATTLAIPDIIELELVSDILGGVARSIGHHRDLLDDLCIPTMMLLKNIRHSLSHPNGLSQLFVASTEEEHAGLEKELEVFANERNVSIVDFAKIPIISSRVVRLLDVVRTISTMLVTFTRAWDIVKGDFGDIGEEAILETEDTASRDNADDPIGIYNDLGSTLRDYVSGLSTSQAANAISARQSLVQAVEVLALLSSSQLILRNSLLPPPEPKWKDEQMDLDGNAGGGGGGGKARRRASSIGGSGGSASEREAKVVYELYKDLMDNLPDGEDGQKGILVWLRAAVYRKLEGIDE